MKNRHATSLFVLLVALAAAFPTLSMGDITSGLIAYYPFSGNANDASGNGYNGTVSGATLTTDRSGNANSAYSFNGTSSVITIGNNSAFNVYPITISAWVQTTQNSPTYAAGIVNKYYPSSGNGYMLSQLNGKFLGWYDHDSNNEVSSNPYIYGGVLTNGNWHFIAFVVDATGGTYYFDGNNSGIIAWKGSPSACTTSESLKIGYYPGNTYFSGKIDEVRLYNRALTSSDIQELYSGNTNACSGSLQIGSASGQPGASNVSQSVNISYSGSSCVTQAQFDISYNDTYLDLVGADTGSASSSASKSCSYNILGTGSARIICAGQNTNVIGSGELVRLKWNISSSAPQGQSTTTGCSNATGTDANASTFSMSCSSGTISFSSGNCCDLNSDSSVNVGDLQTLVNVILGKQSCPK